MKYLFLTQGLPGSGKSTFLARNHLTSDGYVISSDTLRLQYSAQRLSAENSYIIPQKNDKVVWKHLFELLEYRMIGGDTTIVDATHYSLKMIKSYKSLCEKYGYTLYLIDFTDIELDIVLTQNVSGGHKRVPEDTILRMKETIEAEKDLYPKWIHKISTKEFLELWSFIKPFDFNKYEEVNIFGDIHGCYQPLLDYFEAYPFKETALYLFVGDYLDRGIQNKEVLEFLIDKAKNYPNFKFLEGNHEKWLRHYSKGEINLIKSKEFLENTIPQIQGIDLSDIRIFIKKLTSFQYFTFNHYNYLVTHGGIPCLPSLELNEYDYITGVGGYGDSVVIDSTFSKNCGIACCSIHGHRNSFNELIHNTRYTYNLEGDIEHGGSLRGISITRDGIHEFSIRNHIIRDLDSNEEMVKALEKSPLIKIKSLQNGIKSYNFTRDAFENDKWNKQTITARGLFIGPDNEIVARSYNKFFNLGENNQTTIERLRIKLKFPVTGWLKENGSLGMLSWNPYINDYFIASKSTNEGEFAERLRNILYTKYNINKNNELKEYLKKNKVTFIFEVISPDEDPHIIDYKESCVILLDVVTNSFKPKFYKYEKLEDAAAIIGCNYKTMAWIANNMEELEFILSGYKLKPLEGFVVEDSIGYRFKWKTRFYTFWKRIRNCFAKPSNTIRELFSDDFALELACIDNIPNEKKEKYIENGEFRVIKFYKDLYNSNVFKDFQITNGSYDVNNQEYSATISFKPNNKV